MYNLMTRIVIVLIVFVFAMLGILAGLTAVSDHMAEYQECKYVYCAMDETK